MQFFYFHLMPWPHLPANSERRHRSLWITFPNRAYDPARGQALYNEYLDELERAEALGFDGLGVNEHHQTAYGTGPAPNLIAAALVRRTTRARIAILGNSIALRDHPLRVAEEVALLDVLSGGRIISGFVRGIGCEYLSLGVNPTYSRERFYEAHDLIVRAWTEDGPFAFEGKHFRVRYANIWPRPLQQPHPPIWLPSQGSTETIRFAVQRRYPFVTLFTSYAQTKRLLEEYKAEAERAGYNAPPQQLGLALPVYVAESDAGARAEAEPHVLWLFRRGLRIPPHLLLPPGYVSEQSLRKFLSAGLRPPSELSFEELQRNGYVLAGSPATIVARLQQYREELGFGLFIHGGRIGDMPRELAFKSQELFAREVIPALRPGTEPALPAGTPP
ncbi:MAG: LLM class flavin-dependent oxidoreductase [Deltaproteobacteria bacterium]|nr:LLM class flavin-dependent oxidoreductase [Deltaproteobacteria bacterium]